MAARHYSSLLTTISIIMDEFRLNKRLSECRLPEVPKGVEAFCYTGKMYEREKFVLLTMKSIQDEKYSEIKGRIIGAKKALDRGSANAELIAAELSAYLRVLSEKKKPMFYVDDGHGLY